MKVLFLTQNDARGASTRLRVCQYLAPLARRGIAAELWPLPLGMAVPRTRVARGALYALQALRRIADVPRVRRFDVVVIQRDLIAHVPPVIEEAMARVNPALVIDLDDPIHLHPPARPPLWPFHLLRDPRKLERLVRIARRVIVANRVLRAEVERVGGEARVIPTSIDTGRWTPSPPSSRGPFTVGWIGSPGTTTYLEGILPALGRLAREIPCRLRAIGADPNLASRAAALAPRLLVEILPWTLDTEVEGVRSFDAGVMPLTDDPWSRGKSATKLLQYMACGIPSVASPVGANADIVKDGLNGLLAVDEDAWVDALGRIAGDARQAARIGREGRATVVAEYSVETSLPRLEAVLRKAATPCR